MEKKITSKTIFENDFLTLKLDQVELQNGKSASRVYVNHIGAACVLPITKDGMILLTKQYRYPIKAYSLEIPAGKRDAYDEDYLDCIKRELEEETGYQSNKISYMRKIHNCVGYSDEIIEMFIAHDCEKVEHPMISDEDEFIDVIKVSKEEAFALLKDNHITDVKTIVALQTLLIASLQE